MKYKRPNRRQRTGRDPRAPFSRKLRRINAMIGRNQIEQALKKLSKLVSEASTSGQKAKIISQIAITQIKKGRFKDAIENFSKSQRLSNQNASNFSNQWMDNVTCRIRAMLMDQDTENAYAFADRVGHMVSQRNKALDQQLDLSAKDVERLGKIRVAPRSVRPSVALTRIGSCFYDFGYPETANEFFKQAVVLTPNGASRARQYMAKIAFSAGEYDQSEQWARESILMGRFQAKTIPSWQVLIQARHAQNKPPHDATLFESLLQTQQGSVSARSVYNIVKGLRSVDDETWLEITSGWLSNNTAQDRVISFELNKILLAHLKNTSSEPLTIYLLAKQLLEDSLVSPSETTGLAKMCVQYGTLASVGDLSVAKIVRQVRKKFGARHMNLAIHAMSLGAIAAADYDTGRNLLRRQIRKLKPGSELWGKSLWALARMEATLKNHSIEADCYLQLASHKDTPTQFRAQGFMRWFKAGQQSGQELDVKQAQDQLRSLVENTADYKVLLDMGRQLSLGGRQFRPLLKTVAARGEGLAWNAFEAAESPAEALFILNHLARRQYYDLYGTKRMLKQWESFKGGEVEAMWSADARFWEYLSLVMRGYFETEQVTKGEELANRLLADPGIPETGIIYIGSHYAQWLMDEERGQEAFKLFKRLLKANSSHKLSSYAHYWQALRHRAAGRRPQAIKCAQQVRNCFNLKPALHWEWAIDAKAGLLLEELSYQRATIDLRLYEQEFIERQKKSLGRDMKKVAR